MSPQFSLCVFYGFKSINLFVLLLPVTLTGSGRWTAEGGATLALFTPVTADKQEIS